MKYCSICSKELGLNRYKIKNGWLCPDCNKMLKPKFGFIKPLEEIKSEAETNLKKNDQKKPENQLITYAPSNLNGISINVVNKKIYLLPAPTSLKQIFQNKRDQKEYNFKDILSSEILENGSSILKTNRSSQIGGAVLGSILAGPFGMLIGGLSGSKRTDSIITKIDLRIIINDLSNPSYFIPFLTSKAKKGSWIYNSAIESARKWHNLFEVAIKQADIEDSNNLKDKKTESHISIADELNKLAELKLKGLISEEEFSQLKLKLINN